MHAAAPLSRVRATCAFGRRASCRRPDGRGAPLCCSALLAASPYAAELGALLIAARRAVRAARLAQETILRAGHAAAKADASPVTVADFAAQALISWTLASLCPSIPLLAEEDASSLRGAAGEATLAKVHALVTDVAYPSLSLSGTCDAIDRGSCGGGPVGAFFVADPIDGTKGYVAGRHYAVALALIVDGIVQCGVVACPNLGPSGAGVSPETGTVFAAAAGCGCYAFPLVALSNCAADGGAAVALFNSAERLSCEPSAEESAEQSVEHRPLHTLRLAESFSGSVAAAHDFTAAVSARLGLEEGPTQMDSCAKYGLIARGDADLYLRFPPPGYTEKIWDHAAGYVVLTEAGGVLSDANGAPIDWGAGRDISFFGGLVGAPKSVHAEVVAAARAQMGAEAATTTQEPSLPPPPTQPPPTTTQPPPPPQQPQEQEHEQEQEQAAAVAQHDQLIAAAERALHAPAVDMGAGAERDAASTPPPPPPVAKPKAKRRTKAQVEADAAVAEASAAAAAAVAAAAEKAAAAPPAAEGAGAGAAAAPPAPRRRAKAAGDAPPAGGEPAAVKKRSTRAAPKAAH